MPVKTHPSAAVDVAVIIPAYRPDVRLLELVHQLSSSGLPMIVVIDDGSGEGYRTLFDDAGQIENVRVLHHPANAGKGAALKTGIQYALNDSPQLTGVVTADADGQHRIDDILSVASALRAQPDALVLGARVFEQEHVPLRSRIGNVLTRRVMRFIAGQDLTDTQTGLRGIPASFCRSLLQVPSNGYEFELDMLIEAHNSGVTISEAPIATIYEPGNKSSHFNPIVDSMRIYFVFLRFCSVALLTALLDNLCFYVAYRRGASLLGAQAFGRAVGIVFNYVMVRSRVFRAKGDPRASFSRYVVLALASGASSYMGIRLGISILHAPVLSAKIVVEALLFFANFIVERDWVFAREEARQQLGRSRIVNALLWIVLLAAIVVEIVGFRTARLLDQVIWTDLGLHHLQRFTIGFASFSLPVCVLFRRFLVPLTVAAVLVCSVWAVGPIAVGAVLLLVFSATVLGRLLFGSQTEGPLALMAGLAVWIFVISLTARLPVHYVATYAIALLLPVAAGFRETLRLIREWLATFRPAPLNSFAEAVAFAMLAFIVLAQWLMVLKPEVSTDGLAMHLAIASHMARQHAFLFDIRHFVWSLMPMGSDWCYTMAYMMGGEYAARLLNFAMLLALVLLLFRILRQLASSAIAIGMTALFVSTPLVQLVTGSMFVENFVAAMCFAGIVALWRFHEIPTPQTLLLTALLLGSAVALKLGAIAVVVLALALLARQAWIARPSRAVAITAILIVLATGSLPYVNAYVRSRNPIFPYANNRFHSPYVGNDLVDTRFHPPLSWRTPARLTFETNEYFEGQNGSFGFQYLLLLPLALICLAWIPSFLARSAALTGLGGALIILATQPNARYLYTVLPLFTVAIAAGIAWIKAVHPRLFQASLAAALLCGALNVYFLAASGWHHKSFYTAPMFSARGRQEYLKDHGPVRQVIAYVNGKNGTHPVFYADSSEIADIDAPAYRNSWHDYEFSTLMDTCARPIDVYKVLANLGVQYMIVNRDADRQPPVTAFLKQCGEPEFAVFNFSALRLREDCPSRLARPN